MKSIVIPDSLFRDAQTAARKHGVSVGSFFAGAVRARLAGGGARKRKIWPVPPPKVDKAESRQVERRIASEFGRIDLETWR